MKTHIIFGITALVLIIAFMFGSSYYKGKQAEEIGFMARENAELFVRDHSQTLGSDDAKVYLVEFMDPACETCAAFSSFVKQMIVTNPGKIKLAEAENHTVRTSSWLAAMPANARRWPGGAVSEVPI